MMRYLPVKHVAITLVVLVALLVSNVDESAAVLTDSDTLGSNALATAATFPITNAVTGAGTSNSYTNPGNAAADDNSTTTYTSVRNVTDTSYFAIPNFSAIPNGSTIQSVTLGVRWNVDQAGRAGTLSQGLVNGTTAVGGAAVSNTLSTTTETLTTSNPTPTLAELKAANLQVQIKYLTTISQVPKPIIDYIYVTVVFT